VAAVIYNNLDGSWPAGPTLAAPPRPEGPYIPMVGVLQAQGNAWKATIDGGGKVVVAITIEGGEIADVWTQNVIAQTAKVLPLFDRSTVVNLR
jgi:hypothetical protein